MIGKAKQMGPRPREGVPLYVAIPSVRPTIMPALCKWFVHAIEARAGQDLVPALRRLNELARQESDPLLKDQLRKIRNVLRRRLRGMQPRYEHPIHFVVADNSAFHPEASKKASHSPDALRLAASMNRIGNPMGIYVHYITPAAIAKWFPKNIPDEHPYAHMDGKNIRMSPGAALNVALSYIRGYHESHHDNPTVRILKIDDDINPTQGEFSWGKEPRQYRNFFLDQKSIEINRTGYDKRYRGYPFPNSRFDSSVRTHGSRTSDDEYRPLVQMFEAPIEKICFVNTTWNESLVPSRYRVLSTPGYFIHSGRTSTIRWMQTPFGRYRRHDDKFIEKAPEANVTQVIEESRIKVETQNDIPNR